MKIVRLHIENCRTLVDVNLTFPSFYSAICGKNDAGKTNLVRAIRMLMKEEEPWPLTNGLEFSLKTDFPKWKQVDAKQSRISVTLVFDVHHERDAGLFDFLNTYLSLNSHDEQLSLELQATYGGKEPEVSLSLAGQSFKDTKAQEVLKKLQSSRVVLFHSSVDPDPRMFSGDSPVFSETFPKKTASS